MKSFLVLAALAASVNGLALFGRAETACCFHLSVTGDVTGPLGQLTDGQSRVGDNSLSQSLFCINSTGVIVESTGKGCIITTETTQFQCDEGKPGTPGFSIASSGQLQFHGSDYFIACETGQNGGKNIYTTNSTSVTRCKAVYLNADSCVNTGSAPVVSIPPAPASNVTGPGGAISPGAPGGSAAGSAAGSPVTIVSTVTVSNCVCSATATPGTPAAPAPVPIQASSASSPAAPGASSQTPSAPAGSTTAAVPLAPAPGHSSVSSASASAPAGGAESASGATASPTASAHTSIVPVVPVPDQSSATSASTASASPASASEAPHASGTSSTNPSTPCPSSSPCPTCSHPATSSTTGASTPCPSCPPSAVTSSGPPPSSLTFSVTSFGNTTRPSSVPATSPATTPPTSIRPVNPTSTIATSTSTSTSCPTNLSGEFQFPHLIVRIDSAKPDTPHGTGLNGTVNSTVATTFNFDIPPSYSGKTCSLIFLFPRKEDLQTTSFSFSGDGKVAFGKLSQTVSSSTTYNNVPSVSQGLGTIAISPGNSYQVSTFACPAGQALAFEMKNAGSTDFDFFEDWNPSPLGLFITAC